MRLHDWPERLQALIDSRMRAPFAWGSHDCCLFVVAAIEAVTGRRVSVAAYSSERGAFRVLRAMGGFERAVEAAGGRPEPVGLAQRGDVLLVEQAGLFGRALAVCGGAQVLAAGPVCLVPVPRARWLAAWSI